MGASGHGDGIEATADIEALGSRKGEHRLGKVGLDAIEDGRAEPGRYPTRNAGDDASERVAIASGRIDGQRHGGGCGRVRTTCRIRLDHFEGHGAGIHVGDDVMHLRHPGEDLDPAHLGQQAAGNGTGSDSADGLAGAGASASPPVPVAVLGLVGEVGMRGSIEVAQVVVCAGAGVGVADQHCNGAAGRETVEYAGQDLGAVGLSPLCREAALPGSTAVQVVLDVVDREGEARRTAVDHHADTSAMALSPTAEPEGVSVTVTHEAGA